MENIVAVQKIIFFCEGIALSHYVRPAVLAEMLDTSEYQYWLAASSEYKKYAGDRFIEIPSIDVKSFDKSSNRNKGKDLYTYEVLNEYVKKECTILDEYKPDLVFGDMRFSLGISCRMKGIPYVSLVNAYWSPYSETQKWLPDRYFVRFLSAKSRHSILIKVIYIINRNFTEGYNRLAKENNLSEVDTMEQLYCNADYCFYLDVPQAFSTFNLPSTHHYLGAITGFPETIDSENVDIQVIKKRNKKIVYLSVGSTGDRKKISSILSALSQLDVEVIFVTTNRHFDNKIYPNFTVVRYINPKKILNDVDLVICNGGSGTIYQALEAGKPILAIPSNMDQFMACNLITDKKVGKVFHYKTGSDKEIKKVINELLSEPIYKLNARKFRNVLQATDIKQVFIELMNEIKEGT